VHRQSCILIITACVWAATLGYNYGKSHFEINLTLLCNKSTHICFLQWIQSFLLPMV